MQVAGRKTFELFWAIAPFMSCRTWCSPQRCGLIVPRLTLQREPAQGQVPSGPAPVSRLQSQSHRNRKCLRLLEEGRNKCQHGSFLLTVACPHVASSELSLFTSVHSQTRTSVSVHVPVDVKVQLLDWRFFVPFWWNKSWCYDLKLVLKSTGKIIKLCIWYDVWFMILVLFFSVELGRIDKVAWINK